MKLFFDENIPKYLFKGLKELIKTKYKDEELIYTPESFEYGMSDTDLIQLISDQEGVLITNDKAIRKQYREILKTSNIIVVFFYFKKHSDYWQKVKFTINKWEHFINLLNDNRPYGLKVFHNNDNPEKIPFN